MKTNQLKLLILVLSSTIALTISAQQNTSTLTYRVETSGNVSEGTYAPLWFTANRYGLSSNETKSGYLRAGMEYKKTLKHHWKVQAGIDLAGAVNQTSDFVVQQAYGDISWKFLTLSIGSKERPGIPMEKYERLSSGMMVEGANARPIPQIRGEIAEYIAVPGTGRWLAFKGHMAYGMLTDNNWKKNWFIRHFE